MQGNGLMPPQGDQSNPLTAGAPTWADATQYNAAAVTDWLAQQRAISAQQGLWANGAPTAAGVLNAGQQYGNALLMGTTAPGARPALLDNTNFSRWFGASKAVDADGAPLRVYHGTPSGDFEAFSPDATRTTGGGLNDAGYFFSENPRTASRYAQFAGKDSGAVVPVYLRTERPLDLTAAEFERLQGARNTFRNGGQLGEVPQIFLEEMLKDHGIKFDPSADLIDQIKSAGYDAIRKQAGKHGADQEWMVFHPTQIKSAISNIGAYDRTDPRIAYGAAGLAAGGAAAAAGSNGQADTAQ